MIDMNPYFGGALFIGFLTAIWAKVKAFLSRAYSIFIVEVQVEGHAGIAVKAYCWNNFKRSPFGSRYYNSENEWVRPVKKMQSVAFEMMSTDPIIFWKKWFPIFV